MIKNPDDFENKFNEVFGDVDRVTLSSLSKNKLRFELGGEGSDMNRIEQARNRSNQIFQHCFNGLPLWLRIILWDEEAAINLNKAGLTIKSSDDYFESKNEENILYLFIKKYSFSKIDPVVSAKINYEMAEEPSANITCYFINFEKSIIVNVYDDRGMDIYADNQSIINELLSKFSDWVIQ
jgi:hypothetical protein